MDKRKCEGGRILATIRLIIAVFVIEYAFRYHNIDQNTWFLGFVILFGSWIFGGEVGRLSDAMWKIKEYFAKFMENDEIGGDDDGESVQE